MGFKANFDKLHILDPFPLCTSQNFKPISPHKNLIELFQQNYRSILYLKKTPKKHPSWAFWGIYLTSTRSNNDGDNAGRCMHNLGVVAGDSRDDLGQKRFFPFVAETHLEGAYSFDDDDDDDNM